MRTSVTTLVFICLSLRIGKAQQTAFTCYTCSNCQLPIDENTPKSGSTCGACKMMFSFTGGRTPSNITATCITMAGSPSATQCPSEYKMTPTGAEVTACCKTANCNALPGIGSEVVANVLPVYFVSAYIFHSLYL
ncbi:hypothetical protein CSKR_107319 [Clonorchis sinensis]|uniref:Uncharacterized protein n=1 Tax=Clonorchis sinensis TaxID=79923 RepID=A0A3R7D8Q8_CLOSI|nr:hypothetical protein CSKR_107319 [Clonorchis sinensis]